MGAQGSLDSGRRNDHINKTPWAPFAYPPFGYVPRGGFFIPLPIGVHMVNTIALNDIFELRTEGIEEVTGKRWNTVRHFMCMAVPSDDEMDDYDILSKLAEVWFERLSDTVFTNLSEKWEMTLCRAKRIKPTASIFALYSGSAAGGTAEEVDEPDDCAVISLYTNKAGRKFQGRVFQGGIPKTAVTSGRLGSLFQQGLADKWALALSTDLTATGIGQYDPIVWSPTHYASAPSTSAASAAIQRVMCDAIVRRMTSRDIKGRDVKMGEP